MKRRYEMKFLLSHSQYKLISDYISFIYERDNNSIDKTYPVFSIYFDTKDKDFYYDKIDGYFYHLKVRARRYSQTFDSIENTLLELKQKENDISYKNNTWKIMDKKTILNTNLWDFNEVNKIIMKKNLLYPTVGVYYDREAYTGPNIRITFDYNIIALPTSNLNVKANKSNQVLKEYFCVLEIKSDSKKLPKYLENILSKYNIRISSFSKYTESLDLINRRNKNEL